MEGCGKGFVDRALLARHESTHSKARPFLCPYTNCDKAFKVHFSNLAQPAVSLPASALNASCPWHQVHKHLEYHLQLHNQPDAFACPVDGCRKNFSNPSSLRIHRLLEHESPAQESNTEKQLRAMIDSSTQELATARLDLQGAQLQLTKTLSEVREVRKQYRLLEPKLHVLRREHEELKEKLDPRLARSAEATVARDVATARATRGMHEISISSSEAITTDRMHVTILPEQSVLHPPQKSTQVAVDTGTAYMEQLNTVYERLPQETQYINSANMNESWPENANGCIGSIEWTSKSKFLEIWRAEDAAVIRNL